jgi:large repetitive protein
MKRLLPILVLGGLLLAAFPASAMPDGTAPDSTIDAGPDGGALTPDPTPSFAFSMHPEDPAAAFECRFDGDAFEACGDPGQSAVVFTGSTHLGDGPHSFEVRARDGADVGTSDTSTFTVDATAPDTRITSAPPTSTLNPQPTFGYAVQNEAHPASFECSLDNSTMPCSGTTDGTFTPAAPLAEGQHTFTVRAVDGAGNQDATPATWQFTVDTVAPDTRIDYGPYGKVTSSTPVFGFSSPDGSGARFRCRFDAQEFAPCTNQSQDTPAAPLSPGKHVFEVQAVDRAANMDPTPAAASFIVGACNGRAATYVGTARGDLLKGTPRADVIVGLGGGDVIRGLGGNDILCGSGGKDRINGGPGRDTLFGQGEADSLVGGPGKDRLVGGAGKDAQRP